MSTFVYTAFDAKGKLFRGQVKEKSWTQALRRVKEMGLFPTSVKPREQRTLRERLPLVRPRKVTHAPGALVVSGSVPLRTICAFTRQLATLLEAGISLVRGLRATRDQEENRRFVRILNQIIESIEGGATFSDALSQHPKVFSRIYIKLVVAGEASGMLEGTLARLADFMERTARLRSKIKSSLVYPAAVIFVAITIITVLTVFVIPRFKAVFADRGLPAFTEFLFNSSGIIKAHLPHLGVALILVFAAYKLVQVHHSGRMAIDRFKLKLPVIGRILRKVAIARFARTLGTLLQNGVPVLQSLNIARDTAANMVLARAVQFTHDRVQDGDSLAVPLEVSGVFPSTVISMIDVGEQTGALPNMLLKVADNYEDDVDNAIAAGLSLLEPVIIVFLAIVVGAIVIGMFLPIIRAFQDGFGADGSGID